VKVHELQQLEKLRQMRVERSTAALASLHADMRKADEELRAAETSKTVRIAETLQMRRSFAATQQVSLLSMEIARDMVITAVENVELAENALDACHMKRLDIQDQVTVAREEWNQRQRALDRWTNMQNLIKDEENMWIERREDAEDINKQQNMLSKKT
jgi:hypothetical protein